MLKMTSLVLALLAAGSAQAEEAAVVLKCTATSGSTDSNFPASESIFKIQSGRWLKWVKDGQFWADQCQKIGYVWYKSDGSQIVCSLEDTSYSADGYSGTIHSYIHINRVTGTFEAGTSSEYGEDIATGTCERTAEPVPPPPPPPPPKPEVKF